MTGPPPRYPQPPTCCAWCGHPRHRRPCLDLVQLGTEKHPDLQPCPCALDTGEG